MPRAANDSYSGDCGRPAGRVVPLPIDPTDNNSARGGHIVENVWFLAGLWLGLARPTRGPLS